MAQLQSFLRTKSRATWWEVRRLGWVLFGTVALLLILPQEDPQSNWTLLRFKTGLVLISVLVAHLVRSQLLPYLKLGEAPRSGVVGQAIGAAIVAAALYAAIILGFTLGL